MRCECDVVEDTVCEAHRLVLVQREGAALRTSDEILAQLLLDAKALGVPTTTWDLTTLGDLSPEEREALAWDAYVAERDLLDDLGLRTEWNDGYVIYRVIGGPVL